MNEVLSKFSLPRQDVSLARGELRGGQFAGVSPAALNDLLHELRQPLGIIESLAYYLELTSTDEKIRINAQRIQAMVLQAHGILERAADVDDSTKPS